MKSRKQYLAEAQRELSRIKRLTEKKINPSMYVESNHDDEEQEPIGLSERNRYLQSIKEFNKFSKGIFNEVDYEKMTRKLGGLVEFVSRFTVEEAGDWFDGVTVKRHMKRMQESYGEFEKTAKQMHTLQQRLENCYEDIGGILERYYEIADPEEDGAEDDIQRNMQTESSESALFYVFWNNGKHTFQGSSLWDVKQQAIEKFRIPKSKHGLIGVISKKAYDKEEFRHD